MEKELLGQYYSRRAREYEQIYQRDDPVRQGEQDESVEAMRKALRERGVLEVACGTGYWTAILAEVAQHVVAIDSAREMLAIAREKGLPPKRVEFREGDAYALESVPGSFDAGMVNFWFSHVPKARIDEFLQGFHVRLGPGAIVFMADNVYVPGIGGELVTRPGIEDTFKLRELSDGAQSTRCSRTTMMPRGFGASWPRERGTLRSMLASASGESAMWWADDPLHHLRPFRSPYSGPARDREAPIPGVVPAAG
jgi:SAM-dependent methyltransferase